MYRVVNSSDDDGDEWSLKRKKMRGGFCRNLTKYRMEWFKFLVSNSLAVRKQPCGRFTDEDINTALGVSFSEDDCQLMASGSIQILKDGQMVPLSKLCTGKCRVRIFGGYTEPNIAIVMERWENCWVKLTSSV